MKKPPVKIEAVLFDFGGTLDSDGIPWKEHFLPFYRANGIDWPAEKYDRCFYDADDRITAHRLKNTPYRRMLALQAGLVLKNGGSFNPQTAEKISEAFYKSSMKTIRKNLPVLRRLSKKYRLGIVSNFYGNLPALCRETGISSYVKVVVDSARAGFLKPHPRIFSIALEKLRVPPENAVFVGDSLRRDMIGARSAGMRHVWLKAGGAPKQRPCCPKDPVIRSLRELEGVLTYA